MESVSEDGINRWWSEKRRRKVGWERACLRCSHYFTVVVPKVLSSLQTRIPWPEAPKSSKFLNRPTTLYPLSVGCVCVPVRVWERQRDMLTAVMCLRNAHQHTFGSFAYSELNSRQHPECRALNSSVDSKRAKLHLSLIPHEGWQFLKKKKIA